MATSFYYDRPDFRMQRRSELSGGLMAILRVVRLLCGVLAMGAFLVGAVSVFQSEWGRLGLTAIAWFIAMLVFMVAQNGIERVERGDAAALLSGVDSLLARGDWQGALSRTTEATQLLSKSVKATGKRSDQIGPLASTLVMHSLVLGVIGDVDGAQSAASRAVRLLERLPNRTPLADEILTSARDVEDGLRSCSGDPSAAAQFCRSMV